MDVNQDKLRADFTNWAVALRDAAAVRAPASSRTVTRPRRSVPATPHAPRSSFLQVPIFMNQWSVVHGVDASRGRFDFIADVASLAQELNFGWTWFPWRGRLGITWHVRISSRNNCA